jgi:hypothetical protein
MPQQSCTLGNREITQLRAEQLLKCLLNFSIPNRQYIGEWKGGKTQGGVTTFRYPVNEEDVLEFFHLASREYWDDYEYRPEVAGKIPQDDRAIETADIKTIKTLLTFCVGGEKFFDGHWGSVLQVERIQKLLTRLQQLVPTFAQ